MDETAETLSDAPSGLLAWLNGGNTVALLLCIAFGAYVAYVVTNEPVRDGTQAAPDEKEDETEPPRDFTAQQLRAFDGKDDDTPLYVSLKGDVFDVSEARSFYGPGGGYALFAGRDASKCLATMSLEEADLDQPVDALNFGEREQLDEWHFKFKEMCARRPCTSLCVCLTARGMRATHSVITHRKGYPLLGRLAAPADGSAYISRKELLARGTGSCAPLKGRCCAEHLIAVRGQVYDVGYGGVEFYGAGCSYHLFCGRDASRALSKMSFKPEDVSRGWPDLADLDAKDTNILDDWEKLFARKYPVVARLHERE